MFSSPLTRRSSSSVGLTRSIQEPGSNSSNRSRPVSVVLRMASMTHPLHSTGGRAAFHGAWFPRQSSIEDGWSQRAVAATPGLPEILSRSGLLRYRGGRLRRRCSRLPRHAYRQARKGDEVALDEPVYENMIQERDVMVRMRDGVHLAVDVYRPKAAGQLSGALHLRRPQQGPAAPGDRRSPAAAAGLRLAVVRRGRGRRHQAPGRQRLRPRDRRAARGGQVRGRLRRRTTRPTTTT